MIDIWGWRRKRGLSDKYESMENYEQGFDKILVEGMYHAEDSKSGKLTDSYFCRGDELLEEQVVVEGEIENEKNIRLGDREQIVSG